MESVEAKNSVMVDVLGPSAKLKVVSYITCFDFFDFSKSHVAKATDVSRATVEKMWPELVQQGLVVQTRRIGRAVLYKTNTESRVIRAINKFSFELGSIYADEEEKGLLVQKITAKNQKLKGGDAPQRRA